MSIYKSQPYTYLIGWSHLDRWYYGCQYGSKANPNNLWKTYFTSSKYVWDLREKYGEPDIVEVRKIFITAEECVAWESKVLRRLNVLNSERWVNKNIAGAFVFDEEVRAKMSSLQKGSKNGMYGKTHTPEVRKRISEYRTGSKTNPETIEKIRKSLLKRPKGENHYMYGRKLSLETRQKMSRSQKGVRNPKFMGYFQTPWGSFATVREAVKCAPTQPMSPDKLAKYCKYSETTVTHKMATRFSYLKTFSTKEVMGKTFTELGFGFLVQRQKDDFHK